ncbi:helix-turn-helix transcriptional regulator [Ihubacter sp. mB4P-1]|uniref:helix-turn-helix transcriptional regulator n=1 Tax=Ihubacter sp. mB4P-1 TaxID=3242370 RepID=UPI00137ABF3B
MTKEEFINECNQIEKLIRTEYRYSQDHMAEVLGISKKTLVEIEKGRRTLGWSGSIVLCTLFDDSQVLAGTFGGIPSDMIQALAFEGRPRVYPKTMGGNVWWREIEAKGKFKIQQNIISQHYRILDNENCRRMSSFSLEEVQLHLNMLQEE